MALRRFDAPRGPIQRRARDAQPSQSITGEFRAPALVVTPARIVDGVVEPQGEFDLGRALGAAVEPIEPGQAEVDVRQRVVAPTGLAVSSDQLFEDRVTRMGGSGGDQGPLETTANVTQVDGHDPASRSRAIRTRWSAIHTAPGSAAGAIR